MGFALIASGNNAATSGSFFNAVSNGGFSTTESQVARTIRIAGTFSNYGGFNNQPTGTTRTITARKNSSSVNGFLSFAAGSQSAAYDNNHSDAYSATDTFDYSAFTSSGNIGLTFWKTVFLPSSGHATMHSASPVIGAGTSFSALHGTGGMSTGAGNLNGWSVTEANCIAKMRSSGNVQFTFANVTTASTTTATLVLRKNGSNGNNTLSITANTTGIFEDIADTDAFASGDTLNWQMSGATGTLTCLGGVSCWLNYNQTTNEVMTGFPNIGGGFLNNNNTTLYTSLGGCTGNGTGGSPLTEAQTALQHGFNGTSANLRANIITNNNASGPYTWNYRINGANATQTLSVPNSTTGWFEDVTHTDAFQPTDTCAISITTANGPGTGRSQPGTILTTEQPGSPPPMTGLFGYAETEW